MRELKYSIFFRMRTCLTVTLMLNGWLERKSRIGLKCLAWVELGLVIRWDGIHGMRRDFRRFALLFATHARAMPIR